MLGGIVLSAATWFVLETWVHGPDFIREFLTYQIRLLQTGDAGHSGFPGYELVIFIFGCFPLSAFALRGLFRRAEGLRYQRFQTLARVWLLFVIILFALVRTKIPHYTSLTYIPGAFLAALELESIRLRAYPSRSTRWLWGITGITAALPLLALPWLMRNPDLWTMRITDPFALANIQRAVDWPWYTFLPGAIFAASLVAASILIRRKRWLSALRMQLGAVVLTVVLAWPLLLPKIEAHSQGGAVAIYESLQNESVDVCIAGFKSYAHLYYLERKAWTAMDEQGRTRLVTQGERPLFIVGPVHRLDEIHERYPSEEIRRDGGFVLLRRCW
jgi:branched-subunit amino acid transport protein